MTSNTKIRLLLLAAILIVFGQVITHEFVDWDDGLQLYQNPTIVNHSLTGLLAYWNPFSPQVQNVSIYCPMIFTAWWLLAHLSTVQSPDIFSSTLNPYIYHAANLAVHWLCACLVFEILLRFRIRFWPAVAGAMLFAIHPLQTEAVAWASAMKDLLGGFFSLLTLLTSMNAAVSPAQSRKKIDWLPTLFFILALLSKPSAVVLPVIVAVIDRYFFLRPWKEIARRTWYWYLLSLAAILITAHAQFIPAWVGGPRWAHPLIAANALAFYLFKLMVPIHLKFDYGLYPQKLLSSPYHVLYWSWIFPALIALLLWRGKNRILLVSAAIFALALLPVLGLKTFVYEYYSTVADRYAYVSMLGAAFAGAWIIQRFGRRAASFIAVPVLCILGSLSFVQARQWIDTPTLYKNGLAETRPLHLSILGEYEDALAEPYLRRAQLDALAGNFPQQRADQDQALAHIQDAIDNYQHALDLDPNIGQSYNYLARDLVRLGRINQAIDIVQRWIRIDPTEEFEKPQKPGRLQDMLGMLYVQTHQYDSAIAAFRKSLAEQDDPQVRADFAKAQALADQSSHPATRSTNIH